MYAVKLLFRDNNGNEAQTRIHLSEANTNEAAVSFVLAAASAMEALSDALLVRVILSRVVERGQYVPPNFGTSNVFSRLVLFFRNGQYSNYVRIPAARRDLPYDSSGPYRSYRITNDSFLSSPVLQAFSAVGSQFYLPNGQTGVGSFVVGCRTRET